MKLITEHMSDVEYVVEDKGKTQYIKGVFMQADVKNQNGRVYPFSVLHRNSTFSSNNLSLCFHHPRFFHTSSF